MSASSSVDVKHPSRKHLADWYRRNRARSADLFALIDPAAWTMRPIPLRHPFAFYAGHLPVFSFLTLNRRALHEAAIDERLEKLYERGIDPSSEQAADSHARSDWPDQSLVAELGREIDRRVIAAIESAPLKTQALYTVLEHEQMHHETLMYIVTQLDSRYKCLTPQIHTDSTDPIDEWCAVPAGVATLGAMRDEVIFGWDNEFGQYTLDVPAFRVQRFPVTNGAYLEYVRTGGGSPPPFWIERDGAFVLRGTFEELPLMASWPVWVSHNEAQGYARWKGKQLMTEAQYHRAAVGTPTSIDHGNFDFMRFDAEPVDAHPDGRSAWGIEDLVGNGWEITNTPFAPFPGFQPMATYPQYSTDFFDGKHVVMKGASPVTARELVRRSFRNWFYADYPYAYGKFRLVD